MTRRRVLTDSVVTLSLYGAHKAEDRRLAIAKAAARDIKRAIDEVRMRRDVDVDYPGFVTVDCQTFYWSQLLEST